MASQNLEKEFTTLKDEIERLRADFAELTQTISNIGGEGVHQAREKLGKAFEDGQDKVRKGGAAIEHEIEERPFTSIGLAFGIGLVLGRVMSR